VPKIVNGEPVVGLADTFWNAPETTIAGLIGIEVAAAATSAVTTNCASVPVEVRDCGLTANTPGQRDLGALGDRAAQANHGDGRARLARAVDVGASHDLGAVRVGVHVLVHREVQAQRVDHHAVAVLLVQLALRVEQASEALHQRSVQRGFITNARRLSRGAPISSSRWFTP
jgi:hypothetical protein